jgi:hypothetical protein
MNRTTPSPAGSGLRRRPQLGEAPSPRVGVLRAVPDVAAEEQLGRELRRERDPAAEDAHHALLDEPVVADAAGGRVDAEVAGETVGGHRTAGR